jgi:RNA polymerase sigma-70 factor (ECF subfamily)
MRTPSAGASVRSPWPADPFVTLAAISTHFDDAALVAAAQGGDRNALDQLLRRHYDRILAVCRRIAGSSRDGDDACQEALIKIARNLPRFDGRSSFGTWAYRIATNASLDEVRKRNRRPNLTLVDSDGERPDLADPDANREVDGLGDRLVLDAALATLPEESRAAVVLRDVANLDYAEIAEILDIPIGTVKSRISRGRAALATELRLESQSPHDVGNQTDLPERPTDLT